MNKGYVVVLSQEEHDKLKNELKIMQKEILEGGPWSLSVSILYSIVHNSVNTDLSCEEDQSERILYE